MLRARLLDQRADDVRHGARHRHPGRRCDRRGRERRAHHDRGRPVAARRDRARRWGRSPAPSSASRGAGFGVRADGVLPRLGRQHLSAILARRWSRDRFSVAPRAVADAGACARPCSSRSRPATITRSAASSAGSTAASTARQAAIRAWVAMIRAPALPDADLCGDPRRRGVRSSSACRPRFLPNEDQGFIIANVPSAAGRVVSSARSTSSSASRAIC